MNLIILYYIRLLINLFIFNLFFSKKTLQLDVDLFASQTQNP